MQKQARVHETKTLSPTHTRFYRKTADFKNMKKNYAPPNLHNSRLPTSRNIDGQNPGFQKSCRDYFKATRRLKKYVIIPSFYTSGPAPNFDAKRLRVLTKSYRHTTSKAKPGSVPLAPTVRMVFFLGSSQRYHGSQRHTTATQIAPPPRELAHHSVRVCTFPRPASTKLLPGLNCAGFGTSRSSHMGSKRER